MNNNARFEKDPMVRLMYLLIFIGVVCAVAMCFAVKNGYQRSIRGIGDPVQGPAEGFEHWKVGGFDLTITFMNSYDIEGLVVHTKDYMSSDIGDQLSPCDIGLAWGDVAANNSSGRISWSHGNRFLNMSYDTRDADLFGGRSYIDSHVSNNHVIPADMNICWLLRSIHAGDHIRLKGYLVYIDGINTSGTSFNWYSSLTRMDTGNGACEVMYVTSVEWL